MQTSHKLLKVLIVLTLLLGLAGPAALPAAPAPANTHPLLIQAAGQAPEKVVSVIVQKADGSGEAEKLVAQFGGNVTKDLHIINAFAADLTADAALQLAASPSVRWVSLDAEVVGSTGAQATTQAINTYLQTTGADLVRNQGLTGSGVTVAVIDSGVGSHPDLNSKIIASPLGEGDLYGHGTHVAGIVGAGGSYGGVAPGVNLINLRVSDPQGGCHESDVVAALQWVSDNQATYNIRVVNMSLNSTYEGSYHSSALNAASEFLWFKGVVVVVSAGNKGPMGGSNTAKTAPANDPFLISVGASHEKGTVNPLDDTIAPYSAFGVTQDGFRKPDVIAPGSNIISALSPSSSWGPSYPSKVVAGQYITLSGTSMAAPVVTGAVALLLQDEPNLTPDQVKYRLLQSGRTITNESGTYPYLDVYAIVNGTSTDSANNGLVANQMLWVSGEPITWNSVAWNSVAWNSVAWNSVAWNSVAWNSSTNSSVYLNGIFWGPDNDKEPGNGKVVENGVGLGNGNEPVKGYEKVK